MNEEKTKKKTKNKITSFQAYRNEAEDPAMDQFLRESIIKETEELEARLNSDPRLSGISASDDMFDMIVGKLKTQGYWEEGETSEKMNAERNGADAANGTHNAGGTGEVDEAEEENRDGLFGDFDEEELMAELEAELEAELKIESEERLQAESEIESEARLQEKSETKFEDRLQAELEKESMTKQSKEELTKLLDVSTEEVLRLVELGRKAEKEKQEKDKKRVRRSRFVRRAAAMASAFVILIGVGVNTEAGKGWILKILGFEINGFMYSVTTDYLDEGFVSRIKCEEEQNALNEIRVDLKIAVPEFGYLPEGTEFSGYEIVQSGGLAKLFYEYNNKIINIDMIKIEKERVSYYVLDQQAKEIDRVTNSQEIEMKIEKINLGTEQDVYVADFEWKNCRYVINGKISLSEMKKILEILIIL